MIKNTIKLYKQLSDFNSYGIPNNFEGANRRLNRLSTYHYVYIISAVVGLCLAPLLEYGKCKQENIEKNINEMCGLLGGMWFPLEFDRFPYKQVYYLFQVYSSFVIYQTSSMISFSITETVEHLIIRLRHASNVFVEALTEKNCVVRREKFKNAVKYHAVVMGYVYVCMWFHIL
ncbi:hypothetical protein NQ314_009976 [Rhamnusium bicolor]|uniref:Uncharacterized protein n=1 Tax=Rhamnusium bicolor TaxID=1586634 RepID=A0AAV8XUL3_9CUCU|nr:hypothetical protein NQ314_009976 [Rhamnusium bicolor]